MYPAQTSFMPVQVALARWLAEHGWVAAFKSSYPYWYLGTTPFKYLTGLVVPGLMVGLKSLFTTWNWFEVMWLLIIGFFILGIVGVYFLVRQLGGRKQAGMVSALFYGLGWFSAWSFSLTDGLSLISFSMLVWIWGLYSKWLKKRDLKQGILLSIVISFVLLTNSLIVPSLVLGMIVVILSSGQWKRLNQKIKESIKVVGLGVLGATIWYGWAYWGRLLLTPSFAGKPTFQVVGQVSKLLPMVMAMVLAVVGEKRLRLGSRLARFTFYWLMVFGFLSLLRLIADPDFWMDWTAYGMELQLGLGLGLSQWLLSRGKKSWFLKGAVMGLWIFIWILLVKNRVLNSRQRWVTEMAEYKIGSFLVKQMRADETVFLSGSSVFWLNSWFDIAQVRGGMDKAAVDPDWRAAAWEIREGTEVERSLEWTDKLEIDWLVVHGPESKEFYHDFKHPDKFEALKGWKKVYDQEGDRIYKRN